MKKKYEFFSDKIFNGVEYTRDDLANVVVLAEDSFREKEKKGKDKKVKKTKEEATPEVDPFISVESTNRAVDKEYDDWNVRVLPEGLDIRLRRDFDFRKRAVPSILLSAF